MVDETGLDENKKEMLYHAALIEGKVLKIGTRRGNSRTRSLLESYGSFERIYKEPFGFLETRLKENERISALLRKLRELPEEYFKTIKVGDEKFPKQLEYGAPPVLYIRGDAELLNGKTIGVVGTRKPTKRELEEEASVLERLLAKDYVIVSGLARGCDALAHRFAIENKGKTIAVLGTPLDRNPVKENIPLKDEIAEKGLLVSEYPFGIRTFPSHFVNRNYTIVSLCTEGIVVVSSKDKGGTIHAIRACSNLQRPLYVLKNNLGKNLEWTKKFRFKVP